MSVPARHIMVQSGRFDHHSCVCPWYSLVAKQQPMHEPASKLRLTFLNPSTSTSSRCLALQAALRRHAGGHMRPPRRCVELWVGQDSQQR